MKKHLVLLMVVALPCVASAWEYKAEFSLNSNPNGVWSYGSYVGGFGGIYTLYG